MKKAHAHTHSRASLRALVAVGDADSLAEPLVRVSVIRADGSTPREVGAAMLVFGDRLVDTIGGGALELEAIRHAREMLARLGEVGPPWQRETRDFALGPSLGQCCGGFTRLLFEAYGLRERQALSVQMTQAVADRALAVRPLGADTPMLLIADRKANGEGVPTPVLRVVRDMLSGARPRTTELVVPGKGQQAWLVEPMGETLTTLFIWGAGHVGRAIVHVLEGLPFDIRWVDTGEDRFPADVPAHARAVITADPVRVAAEAPAGAYHLVLTYSHVLDLAITFALLQRVQAGVPFGFLGLIGSQTKRARFLKRLREAGIGDPVLAMLTCPIGLGELKGKEPPVIAVSVAAQLIRLLQSQARHTEMPEALTKAGGP